VIRSEIFENGVTQTISAASFSVDDKSSDSLVTSSNSSDSDRDSSSDDIRQNLEIPSTVTTSHLENDDSSKRLLISDESSLAPEEQDDQPVTTDLTLTKTVELTENDPDPEPEVSEVVEEPPPPAVQRTFDVKKFEIPHPIEMMMERPVEEIKEMSLNNFESTMDDISDNELESLEQELEDLVAIAELSVGVSTEAAVKTLEDSIEKVEEVKEVETPTAVIDVVAELEKPVEVEVAALELPTANENQIEEASAVSEIEVEQKESSVSEAHEAIEPTAEQAIVTPTDHDAVLSSSTDESTSIQNLPSQSNEDFSINESNSTGSLTTQPDLGRVPPYWIPDNMTAQCMQCDTKFSMIKRRHHCRACGLLLCSSCCGEKFFLHYLGSEGRVCLSCHEILLKASQQQPNQPRNPNPANPMEYCSTLPPQQQVNVSSIQPPTVMVPSGVLKRGPRSTERKSVIFSDGIRPGTDLDETASGTSSRAAPEKPPKFNMPTINEKTNSFIPETANELPPVLLKECEFKFIDNNLALLQRLRQEELKFAINKNFYVTVKIVTRELCLVP
jgi:MAD, mothers against decapentaplegic interacting protein